AVLALAGTAVDRVILGAPVPLLAMLARGAIRERRTAGRLRVAVVAGDPDGLSAAARFLDRHDEPASASAALRLAAARSRDPFVSASYDLQAADPAARTMRPGTASRRADLAIIAWVVIATIMLITAFATELVQRT